MVSFLLPTSRKRFDQVSVTFQVKGKKKKKNLFVLFNNLSNLNISTGFYVVNFVTFCSLHKNLWYGTSHIMTHVCVFLSPYLFICLFVSYQNHYHNSSKDCGVTQCFLLQTVFNMCLTIILYFSSENQCYLSPSCQKKCFCKPNSWKAFFSVHHLMMLSFMFFMNKIGRDMRRWCHSNEICLL